MLGKRHIAEVNQNIAEPHAAISAPISMNDLIVTPNRSGMDRDYTCCYRMLMSAFGTKRASAGISKMSVFDAKRTLRSVDLTTSSLPA